MVLKDLLLPPERQLIIIRLFKWTCKPISLGTNYKRIYFTHSTVRGRFKKKQKPVLPVDFRKETSLCLSMLLPLVHVFLYEHSGVKASAYATLPE